MKNLRHNTKNIIEENKKDIYIANQNKISEYLINRLEITNSKIDNLIYGINTLCKMDDPIGKILESKIIKDTFNFSDNNLLWTRKSIPIGLVMVIFESRPDVIVQLLSLSVLSGNGLVLKGGTESFKTNKILFDLFLYSIPENLHVKNSFIFINSREETEIAMTNKCIDLIIPRGSKNFINWIKKNTEINVIGHGSGICCAYIHNDMILDIDILKKIITHSKLDYPAACNSLEVIWFHKDWLSDKYKNKYNVLINLLKKEGIDMIFNKLDIIEHCDKRLIINFVDSTDDAIKQIIKHGSHHTDLVFIKDKKVLEKFMISLPSSCLFSGCSSRMSDGFRMGLGCEIGINTNSNSWYRGPVGLEGMMTTQINLKYLQN